LAILIVCLMVPAVARAADGTVLLYLQPFAAEASRLTFSIASASAVSADGGETPLRLNLKSIADMNRQRLLAAARLPSGNYAGFVFRIKQASLKREQGEAALSVPDAPVRVDIAFAVGRQQEGVFWISLRFAESVSGAYTFSPVFSAVVPPKPIADLAGFVSNFDSNTITVFDKRLNQATGVIDTCAGPAGLALDQQRGRLYVACSKDDEIQSIDVVRGEVLDRVRVAPGDRPNELAVTPDGSTLVSANTGSNSVSFFDAASLSRQERVEVGRGPRSVVIDPAGRQAIVFNTLSSSVSVIDIGSRRVVGTASAESPSRGKFNARGDRLYVIQDRSPFMIVLDPRQLTLVTRARLSTPVSAISIDNVRNLVCLAGTSDAAIEFYDPNALLPLYVLRTRSGGSYLVSEIDVGDGPCAVAVAGER
jgi:YVTN family beta-propeller protein